MDAQIDTRWFQNQLADKRLSQRQLAKRMALDPAAVSLMLRGKRKMSASEAAEIAAQLGVSADEVLMRAGSAPTLPARHAERVEAVAGVGGWEAPDKDIQIVKVSGPMAGGYGMGSLPKETTVRMTAKGIDTSAPELGRPEMIELPVPMSDGSTARLVLPRKLSRSDADRIAALVQAIAMP